MNENQPKISRASERERACLKDLRESGMGYQKITTDHSGDYYVFNGEYLLPLREGEYDKFLSYVAENDVKSFEELTSDEFKTDLDNIQLIDDNDKPKGNKVFTRTEKNQLFYRFSHFKNDFRVDSEGNFIKGTYGTSYSDIRLVPSGLAAVGRYALRNPFSANYVYILLPVENTEIVICTVAPDNNQAGGGVEVFFPKGGKFKYAAHKISRL